MAKQAKLHTTTTEISLFDARTLVVQVYGAIHLAERLLVEWLGQGLVRWSCKLFKPVRDHMAAHLVADTVYSEGDPAFWRRALKINWEESWAHGVIIGSSEAYGIRVTREDVLAQLPEQPVTLAPTGSKSNKTLIKEEVERRVAAGERWDSIKKFSESLSGWMGAVGVKPLKPRSIENLLHGLGLWPLPSQK
jgi:hypothetical protein